MISERVSGSKPTNLLPAVERIDSLPQKEAHCLFYYTITPFLIILFNHSFLSFYFYPPLPYPIFLPPIFTPDSESDLKLKDSLIQSHKPYCIWFSTFSPSSFLSLHFPSNAVCREKIVAALRAFSLLPLRAIPTLNVSSLSTSSSSSAPQFEIDSLLPSLESLRASLRVSAAAWKPLLTLVLCGWTVASDEATNPRLWKRLCIKIHCQFCRRSLGLWDYQPMFAADDVGFVQTVTNNGNRNLAVVQQDSASSENGTYDLKKDDAEKIVAIVASGK